jgi:uncharacterized Tic20 family protein
VNHQIPLKFRAIAAGLQAIATIPAASVVISPIAYATIINSVIYPEFAYLATGFISIASPIITWILWLFTKSIHPFVDESGRNAINYALNSLLGLLFSALFSVFVFAVTCGSGIGGLVQFGLVAIPLCGIIFFCVATAYFISSIVAGISAWNGSYFKSRFIYPFFR